MENNQQKQGLFYYSLRNLTRTIQNIMTLFGAVGDDLDEIGTTIEDLDDRMEAIEGQTLDLMVTQITATDDILDSSGNTIQDSSGNNIQARAIYDRR